MLLSFFTRKNIGKCSDSELISEISKGDSKIAIGELYKRYGHLMFGVNLKYLKNKMEAEDVLMHVFENLESKIKKSEIKNLKNWLYTVTKNECLMKLRKTNNLNGDIESALLFKADNQEEMLNEIKLNEVKLVTLENAIPKLKDVQQKCIELFYLKSKCYDEIVTITGFDLKKVKSYIQNGKRNLKLILENENIFNAE